MEAKKTSKSYAPEVRERAVRMVPEHRAEHASQGATICSIAAKIGCSGETLRHRVRQAERDGMTTEMRNDDRSAGDGSGETPGVAVPDRAVPPRTDARQFRNIDGEMPASVATCIKGRPPLSSRATASRLNSGENPRLVFGIDRLQARTGLAKASTEARDH